MRRSGTLLWTFMAATMLGCGTEQICTSEGDLDVEGAPRLTDFELVNQLEGDPWTVILSAGFEDSDGNLGPNGQVELFLGGRFQAPALPVLDAMNAAQVDSNATSGTLAMPVRFSEGVTDGSTAMLGIQVVDGSGLRSNCRGVELEFSVK